MWNNCLLCYFEVFWAIILPTFKVQVGVKECRFTVDENCKPACQGHSNRDRLPQAVHGRHSDGRSHIVPPK